MNADTFIGQKVVADTEYQCSRSFQLRLLILVHPQCPAKAIGYQDKNVRKDISLFNCFLIY
jgi:hypothetical protein